MNEIKSILSATDFSDGARRATRRATVLAAALGARLELLHVLSADSLIALKRAFELDAAGEAKLLEDAQRVLDAQVAEAKGVECSGRAVVGDVEETILAAAANVDLVVVGAQGANRLRDMLIGTTAERLLGRSARPVLVVKQAPAGDYRRVLVALDVSGHCEAAVRAALRVAPAADFLAVHAFHVPCQDKLWLAGVPSERIEAHRSQVQQEAQERIAAVLREAGVDASRWRGVVEQDDAAPLVLTQQAQFGADLIVMRKRDRARAGELLLGSVTRRVLSAAPCDVLVVR